MNLIHFLGKVSYINILYSVNISMYILIINTDIIYNYHNIIIKKTL